MEAKFDNLEFKNIDALVAGFLTGTKKDKQKFHLIVSPNIQYNTAMQVIQSVTLHFLTALIKQHPEATDDIFDNYNAMASSVLQNLVPDYQLRKDMDEEAILALEQKMIEEQYDKMTPEQKAKALEGIDKLRTRLTGDADGKSEKDNS